MLSWFRVKRKKVRHICLFYSFLARLHISFFCFCLLLFKKATSIFSISEIRFHESDWRILFRTLLHSNVQLFLNQRELLTSLGCFRNKTRAFVFWKSRTQKNYGTLAFFKTVFFVISHVQVFLTTYSKFVECVDSVHCWSISMEVKEKSQKKVNSLHPVHFRKLC